MSTNDYAGKDTLPPELDQRVRSELAADERLVWVGRPRPDRFRGQTILLSFVGAFCGGVPLFIITVGLMVAVGAGPGGGLSGCIPFLFCLLPAPFVLLGGYMLVAPLWMPRHIRRIIYAITNRRAIVWEPAWFSDRYTVRSYTGAGLRRMHRADRTNGTGDLVFEEIYSPSSYSSNGGTTGSRHQIGFLGIDRVREVEELLRLTLMV